MSLWALVAERLPVHKPVNFHLQIHRKTGMTISLLLFSGGRNGISKYTPLLIVADKYHKPSNHYQFDLIPLSQFDVEDVMSHQICYETAKGLSLVVTQLFNTVLVVNEGISWRCRSTIEATNVTYAVPSTAANAV